MCQLDRGDPAAATIPVGAHPGTVSSTTAPGDGRRRHGTSCELGITWLFALQIVAVIGFMRGAALCEESGRLPVCEQPLKERQLRVGHTEFLHIGERGGDDLGIGTFGCILGRFLFDS